MADSQAISKEKEIKTDEGSFMRFMQKISIWDFMKISKVLVLWSFKILRFSIVSPKTLLFTSLKKYFSKLLATFFLLSILKSMYFFNQSDCLNFKNSMNFSQLNDKYNLRFL